MASNTYSAGVLSGSENVAQAARATPADCTTNTAVSARQWLRDFVAELRQRRVCRAATLYTITLWLIAQIIDVFAEGIGLPDWTIKAVITLGLAGFPIALILSWLFDIVPDRRVARASSVVSIRKRPAENVVDCGLLFAALLIGTQVSFRAFEPSAAVPQPAPSVSVEPFLAASGDGADALSVGLATEIQHRLVRRPGTEVVSIDAAGSRENWNRLSGTIVIEQAIIRAIVSLVDGDSGTVLWSQVFERRRTGNLSDQQALADEILAGLPGTADDGVVQARLSLNPKSLSPKSLSPKSLSP